MTKCIMYKFVSRDWTTHAGMKWEIGKTNKATGVGNTMCTNQVLHCYKSPEQAVLFMSKHVNFNNPILLKIECSEIVANDMLKYASKEQTPISIEPIPVFSTKQRVAFAIKCALLVCKESKFTEWADKWLSGEDQSKAAAYAAADAAYAAADAAAAYAAAAYAAADAAAAAAAADAAAAAYAAAAYAAADADAAAAAAYAAADAADAAAAYAAAAYAAADAAAIDFQEIIKWVLHNIS